MSGAPWWFLDVDGVLNAFPAPPAGTHGWTWRTVPVQVGPATYPVTAADEVLARLREVHSAGLAEIVWCTTWGEAAPAALAPLLDLPPWPVALPPEDVQCAPLPGWSAAPWWKVEAISEWLAADARPYVFTDDDLVPAVADQLRRRRRDLPSCLLRPRTTPGLDPDHLDEIGRFLAEARER